MNCHFCLAYYELSAFIHLFVQNLLCPAVFHGGSTGHLETVDARQEYRLNGTPACQGVFSVTNAATDIF